MINLVGNKYCDKYIEDELSRANIPIVKVDKDLIHNEVPYTLVGSLECGMIKFTRSWNYWVVDGKVPAFIAKKLYEHPEGKISIRIGGHCYSMDPNDYGLRWFHKASGKIIISKEEYERGINLCVKDGFSDLKITWENNYMFDNGEPKEQFATLYHIDEQTGLLLFSMYMREYYENERIL